VGEAFKQCSSLLQRSGSDKERDVYREAEQKRIIFSGKLVGRASVVLMIALALSVIYKHVAQFPFMCFEAGGPEAVRPVVLPHRVLTREGRQPHSDKCIDAHTLRQALLGSELLPLIFCCGVFLCINRTDSSPTPASLDWANVALSVMWMWRYCTLEADWYSYYSALVWASRIIQGIAFGNRRLTIGLHTSVSMTDIVAYRISGLGTLYGYIFGQVIILTLAIALTVSFDELMLSEAQALVEVRRSRSTIALARRLLSAMCDVVVHLDSDLCLAQHCPKLASVLLRPHSSAAMHQPFERFL